MATANMTQVPDMDGSPSKAWEYYEALAAAGSTKDVLVPDGVSKLSVTAESTATSVTVYTTTSPKYMVDNATATWVAWDLGAITTAATDSTDPVTAIRATQVDAGASKLHIRGQ
jgi:hypothetical protein